MAALPLAYHITFGTYGTRLHGDDRPTVDREHNTPGDPYLGADAPRAACERVAMCSGPVTLAAEQQYFVEATMPAVCERGGWGYHIAAAAPDHVHVLVSADADGKLVRRLLKRWLSEALSARWGDGPGAGVKTRRARIWWSEGGSVKWIWNEEYFRRAFDYIARQRADELRNRAGLSPARKTESGCPQPGRPA